MTWHFSSLSDCISPGDVFPFKENHHNSNLWEIGSVLFTSKQEEFSLNFYLIRIKRSYHWSYLHFILHPSLVCILAISPFPWGRICDSWRKNRWPKLHIMLSLEKKAYEHSVVIFDAIYYPNAERVFMLRGSWWNAKESSEWGKTLSSQFSSWLWTQVTPPWWTHSYIPFTDYGNQKRHRTMSVLGAKC